MANRYAIAALVVLLLLPATSPFAVRTFAQMSAACNREMARQDAALRQFDTDARRASADFLVNDAGRTALDGMKSNLAGDPTVAALEDWQQSYDEFTEWLNSVNGIKNLLRDLKQCIDAGFTGCWRRVTETGLDREGLVGKAREGVKSFIDSLANGTISQAADRVDRASGVIENLNTRAGNLATGAASGALQNCMQDMERRVEARSNQTVDLRSQPGAPPPAPKPPTAGNSGGSSAGSGGGMGAGAVAGLSAAAVAGGAGLWYLSEAQKKAQCDGLETEAYNRVNAMVNAANAISGCGTNTSCFNTRISAFNNAFSSFNTAIGNWCTCLGPNATTELSATERATIRDLYNDMRRIGVSPGTLPACFR